MNNQIWLKVNIALFDGAAVGEGTAQASSGGEVEGVAPSAPFSPAEDGGLKTPEAASPAPSAPPAGEERSPEGTEETERLREEAESLRRRSVQLLQEREKYLRQEQVSRQTQRWAREGELTGLLYPQFNMARALEDPQFRGLLRAGIPVRRAYEATHMEDIKALLASQVARQTEKRVVDAIRAKGFRPAENGTAGQSAFTLKQDVSKLSRQDRAEIARRVQRGETGIRF